ncbi:restriction endonuclease subunit S [Faecalibacterium duncaniae]|uniref:Type I restriction modification DNA specificity domain protein n=1 Tax=Faecalibacterium duncaniae (strain DSM 17677 / JCM 31915 / A2-165) TaxID=411483 RepID=C7H8Q6_FAED2|nr:restriction endonuclease subunit S [Faecalibacterium duncaniae]EEU95761.1 type I restriction modification DNA specificity domain protein [Faecalibacterium duncaniae]MDV5056625.1 restriction endonuclease subunit S [Faecalibacterium duncaniae]
MRLGDCGKTNLHTYSDKEKWSLIRYLDTGSITEGRIDEIQTLYPGVDKIPSRARRKASVGDILFSTVRPNQKHYGIIEAGTENLLVSTGFTVVTVDTTIADPYFIYYYLTQSSVIESLQAIAEQSTSTYPSIKPSDIEDIELDLPELETQKKIGSTLRMLDRKIALNEEINDNLYAQAKAIFDNHFINIDAIPAGWRKGNLLDIANYLNGLAMQKFRPQGHEIGLPVLKIKELRQGSCDDSSELCSLSIKPEYIIHNGDVVFSWSGSLLVDIWCGGTCGLNQHLFKVTSDVYDKWFYYLWTAHHLARFIAIAADKATTMGHIKREELAKAEVLIPCEEDYTSFNSIMQPIFELIISNRIESRKLAALRDELLPKLMTGEIDISDVQL